MVIAGVLEWVRKAGVATFVLPRFLKENLDIFN